MVKLDRVIAALDERLVLLAPAGTYVPDIFTACDFDANRHGDLLRRVQRLRGGVYYEDGAIQRHQLSADGLHRTPEDEQAWHLVMLDAAGDVTACAWYREHDNSVHFSRLRLRHSSLAKTEGWRDKLWYAVEHEIGRARHDGLRYAEVGGWAVANESRHHGDAMMLALSAYSLSRVCGGALVVTTATTRHGSSTILSRLGGRPLEVGGDVIPPYYDEQYQCVMELLRFDSREPSRRYESIVSQIYEKFTDVSVVARPYWPMTQRAGAFTNAAYPTSTPNPVTVVAAA